MINTIDSFTHAQTGQLCLPYAGCCARLAPGAGFTVRIILSICLIKNFTADGGILHAQVSAVLQRGACCVVWHSDHETSYRCGEHVDHLSLSAMLPRQALTISCWGINM
jgi:hypothetical protein